MSKNDDRILELKKQIEDKRKAISEKLNVKRRRDKFWNAGYASRACRSNKTRNP